MAESIKYKKPDTYHDAGNVYDNTQGKTQEEINSSILNSVNEIPYSEIPTATTGKISWLRTGNLVWLQLIGLSFSTQADGYAVNKINFASVGLPNAATSASGSLIVGGAFSGELYAPNNGTLEIRSVNKLALWGSIVYPTTE